MTSERDQEKPKPGGKPGPEPERLVIAPEDAEAGLDALLSEPRPQEGQGEGGKQDDGQGGRGNRTSDAT